MNLEAKLETERVTAASKVEQLEEQYASLEAQCANLDSQVNFFIVLDSHLSSSHILFNQNNLKLLQFIRSIILVYQTSIGIVESI